MRTIIQTCLHSLHDTVSPDTTKILVCAPTGTAAFNINGQTLHSAFSLPFGNLSNYQSLNADALYKMRTAFKDLKVLFIDEISMVGPNQLLYIHRRLVDLTGCKEPFGGISILVSGDHYQLSPVKQKAVFKQPKDKLANLTGSLWINLFKLFEMTE